MTQTVPTRLPLCLFRGLRGQLIGPPPSTHTHISTPAAPAPKPFVRRHFTKFWVFCRSSAILYRQACLFHIERRPDELLGRYYRLQRTIPVKIMIFRVFIMYFELRGTFNRFWRAFDGFGVIWACLASPPCLVCTKKHLETPGGQDGSRILRQRCPHPRKLMFSPRTHP